MSRIALFPGSFDPITTGHAEIIERSLILFDKVIIGVGNNINKSYMFPVGKRIEWIKNSFKANSKVEVMSYDGLTVSFCKKISAGFIIRGLRSANDFEFESSIARMNYYLDKDIESVFLVSTSEQSPVSSTIVRDIIKNGGDAGAFVPSGVQFK